MTSRTRFLRAALIAGVVALPASAPVAAFAAATPSPSPSATASTSAHPHHHTAAPDGMDPSMGTMGGSMSGMATADPASTSSPTAAASSGAKTPSGGAATGSGSTQGSSHDSLLLLGAGLIGAAGVTYRFTRRQPARSDVKR